MWRAIFPNNFYLIMIIDFSCEHIRCAKRFSFRSVFHFRCCKVELPAQFFPLFFFILSFFLNHQIQCHFSYLFCSISLVFEQHGTRDRRNSIGKVWRWAMVEAVLWLWRCQHLDVNIHRAIFWLWKWHIFFQVSIHNLKAAIQFTRHFIFS